MAERKVLNFYYGKDFDPSIRLKRKVRDQVKSRIMTPFSLQCTTCGGFTPKARKFHALKEHTQEKYLGITIERFYFSCPHCSATITFKTDPKNFDYVCEYGATRNYDTLKTKREVEQALAQQKADEERGDALKQYENRMLESRREQEQIAALEELQELNQMASGIDLQARLRAQKEAEEMKLQEKRKLEDEEDEEELRRFKMSKISAMLKQARGLDAKSWMTSTNDTEEDVEDANEANSNDEEVNEVDGNEIDLSSSPSSSFPSSKSPIKGVEKKKEKKKREDLKHSRVLLSCEIDSEDDDDDNSEGEDKDDYEGQKEQSTQLLGSKRARETDKHHESRQDSDDANLKIFDESENAERSKQNKQDSSSLDELQSDDTRNKSASALAKSKIAPSQKPPHLNISVIVKPKSKPKLQSSEDDIINSSSNKGAPEPSISLPVASAGVLVTNPLSSLASSLAQYGSDSESD